jgi:hypothetical protein
MFSLPVADYEAIEQLAPTFAEITEEIRLQALESFLPSMQERYLQLLKGPRRAFDAALPSSAGEILSALQTDGYALRALDETSRGRIREQVTPICLELMERLDSLAKLRFSDGQVGLDPVEHAPLYLTVEAALAEAGVLEAYSAYAGRGLGLLRLVAQVNSPRETRMKYGEIDASGLPAHRTSYWHVDSTDWPPVKALIYVSDVELDQGPFRAVKGSHRLMGDFETVVRKTNDKLRQPATHFLSLPSAFRQHANFGDYIYETTPGAAELLAQDVALADGHSDLVMFDNNAVHRGGFVRSGHRFMLQCHFSPADKLESLKLGVGASRAALETA